MNIQIALASHTHTHANTLSRLLICSQSTFIYTVLQACVLLVCVCVCVVLFGLCVRSLTLLALRPRISCIICSFWLKLKRARLASRSTYIRMKRCLAFFLVCMYIYVFVCVPCSRSLTFILFHSISLKFNLHIHRNSWVSSCFFCCWW